MRTERRGHGSCWSSNNTGRYDGCCCCDIPDRRGCSAAGRDWPRLSQGELSAVTHRLSFDFARTSQLTSLTSALAFMSEPSGSEPGCKPRHKMVRHGESWRTRYTISHSIMVWVGLSLLCLRFARWGQTTSDPEPETCPQCLNRGGSTRIYLDLRTC